LSKEIKEIRREIKRDSIQAVGFERLLNQGDCYAFLIIREIPEEIKGR